MKTQSQRNRIRELATFGLLSLAAGVAVAAPPTVSQIHFDLLADPKQVNIVGTNFKAGALAKLGGMDLVVTAVGPTVITADLPAMLAFGDYLVEVRTPNPQGGSVSYALTYAAAGRRVYGARGTRGPEGDVGPAGPTGVDGPIGPAGPQGEQGSPGTEQANGVQGPAGPQGQAGPEGPQGNAGAPGPQGLSGVSGYRVVESTYNISAAENTNPNWFLFTACDYTNGERATGGGSVFLSQDLVVTGSRPTNAGIPSAPVGAFWAVDFTSTLDVAFSVITYAVCVRAT